MPKPLMTSTILCNSFETRVCTAEIVSALVNNCRRAAALVSDDYGKNPPKIHFPFRKKVRSEVK